MNTAATMKRPISRWSIKQRPAERLQRLGIEYLSDVELLAILVGSTTQYSAVDMAKHVLDKFNNNFNTLGKARFHELKDIEGVGIHTACKIMAAVEFGRRRQVATAELRPNLGTAIRIYNFMLPRMKDLDVEEFHVLLMNNNFRLIKSVKIGQGGITETSVDTRIVMREAVLCNATILAAVHNHPSGRMTPSRHDDDLTMSIKHSCNIMRIHFLDHVIVTDGGYYSYHEHGKI
jgi:DNA repair protein RadC